jgi:uncharacterized repeat protein (TIGR03837 family)
MNPSPQPSPERPPVIKPGSHPEFAAIGPGWEIFCRVIDNHGDLGVCWRLARELASLGAHPRLWVDEPSALAWMCAGEPMAQGVRVQPWPFDQAELAQALSQAPLGEWVIEAFGCELPESVLQAMAERHCAGLPLRWFNLEYLSAEDYVERSHLLRSPQFSGPARGLDKRFFYPGFTPRTGGVIREQDLLQRQARFEPNTWLTHTQRQAPWAGHGREGERHISLFCYDTAPVAALLHSLQTSETPHTLLVTPGKAWRAVCAALNLNPDAPLAGIERGALRLLPLPYFDQDGFDELLWASDLNLVRGEDSFVRAQWAGKPWLWNLYPQEDEAHGPKLQAFQQRVNVALDASPAPTVSVWQRLEWLWNQLPAPNLARDLAWKEAWRASFQPVTWGAWQAQALAWRRSLLLQQDLLTQLQRAA